MMHHKIEAVIMSHDYIMIQCKLGVYLGIVGFKEI